MKSGTFCGLSVTQNKITEQFPLEKRNQGRNQQVREAVRGWARFLLASSRTGPLPPVTSPEPP